MTVDGPWAVIARCSIMRRIMERIFAPRAKTLIAGSAVERRGMRRATI